MLVRVLTSSILLLALSSLILPASLAAGTPGPFVGAVAEGDSNLHRYDNNPTGSPCPQVMATYTVTLTYQPSTDTLTLRAGGQERTGSDGAVMMTLQDSWCTSFTITVTGEDVSALAAYEINVLRTTTGNVGAPW